MGGAFQTSRDIFEHPIWQDIPKFRIFFYIVGNAVFSEKGKNVGGQIVKRGQFLRSYRNLRDDLAYLENRSLKKYSLSVIKRKIDSLVSEERLKLEEVELGTLFTVVNYEKYQGFENYKKQKLERSWNAVGTGMERSWNNNKNVKESIKNDLSATEMRARAEGNDGVPITENVQPAENGGRGQISPTSNDFEQLANKYIKLRNQGFDLKPGDKEAIQEVIDEGVPIEKALKFLEDCFREYHPKHRRDRIQTFSYCVGKIFDKHYARKEAKHGTNRRSVECHSGDEFDPAELSL